MLNTTEICLIFSKITHQILADLEKNNDLGRERKSNVGCIPCKRYYHNQHPEESCSWARHSQLVVGWTTGNAQAKHF